MKTMNSSSHWNKFYKTFNLKEETPFARFVIKKTLTNIITDFAKTFKA